MKLRHKIYYVFWSTIVSIAMTNDNLRAEYNSYCYRAWETGRTAMDNNEWLHRRWFPAKYAYEYACPKCGGHSTSYGLCMDCGERWDVAARPAKPM